MNQNQKVICRKCGVPTWRFYQTTAEFIDTDMGQCQADSYLKKEFRCSNCDSKATIEQVAILESVVNELKQPTETEKI